MAVPRADLSGWRHSVKDRTAKVVTTITYELDSTWVQRGSESASKMPRDGLEMPLERAIDFRVTR
jgi:hypothetical protein